MHYYQHNIKDFNSATRNLTRVEKCLYREAIELYYDTEEPIPADNFDRLCRKLGARLDDEVSALRYVLDEFFIFSGESYRHMRCDAEIEKYRANNIGKSIAGKASAEARRKKKADLLKEKSRENLTGVEQLLNPVETPAQQTATNHKPVTSNHKPITNNHKPITHKEISPPAVCDAKTVFDFWHSTMQKPKSVKATPGRMKVIKARLKDYSVEHLKTAIVGCTKSAHHMGKNPQSNPEGRIYDDLTLIMRNPENVDRFMSYANQISIEDVRESEVNAWINGTDKPVNQGETFDNGQFG